MHAQALLPFSRPIPVRLRAVRRPFCPSPAPSPYKLPRDALDRLTAILAPFRNRDAAFALATFLARYWTAPGRLDRVFPIDRRALTDHAALGRSRWDTACRCPAVAPVCNGEACSV